MSEPSMRSKLEQQLPSAPLARVHLPPSRDGRLQFSERIQSQPSAILLTSLVVVCFAISVNLLIPAAAADLTIVSESSEDTSRSTARDSAQQSIRHRLSDDQPIPVSTEPSDRASGGLSDELSSEPRVIQETLSDSSEEVGSGDDGDIVLTSREVKAIDLEMFKRHLLRKMGLEGRPPANDRRSILPAYLWDIYENVAEGATLSSTSDFAHVHENDANDGGRLFSSIATRCYFDTIRTFFPSASPSWPTTLLFDIHRLPSKERWMEAELRVPWHNLLANKLNLTKSGLVLNETLSSPIIESDDASIGDSSREQRKHFFRINLYEVVNETVDIRHLIDTKLINAASSPYWASFDVLSVVSRASMELNVVKLAVEFVDSSREAHVGHFDRSRFISAVSDGERGRLDVDHSAALIMYGFDDDGKERAIKYKNFYKDCLDQADDDDVRGKGSRRKRQAKNKRQRASTGPRLRASELNNRQSSSRRRANQRNQNLCQRRPLIIRFEDLNWQDWILAPQEYAAYYCSGQCSYPFADGQNATNHAIVQALVNSVSPRTVPRPCCVPTETSSISMLHTDIDRNIVIKNYPDMIVEGCGCR